MGIPFCITVFHIEHPVCGIEDELIAVPGRSCQMDFDGIVFPDIGIMRMVFCRDCSTDRGRRCKIKVVFIEGNAPAALLNGIFPVHDIEETGPSESVFACFDPTVGFRSCGTDPDLELALPVSGQRSTSGIFPYDSLFVLKLRHDPDFIQQSGSGFPFPVDFGAECEILKFARGAFCRPDAVFQSAVNIQIQRIFLPDSGDMMPFVRSPVLNGSERIFPAYIEEQVGTVLIFIDDHGTAGFHGRFGAEENMKQFIVSPPVFRFDPEHHRTLIGVELCLREIPVSVFLPGVRSNAYPQCPAGNAVAELNSIGQTDSTIQGSSLHSVFLESGDIRLFRYPAGVGMECFFEGKPDFRTGRQQSRNDCRRQNFFYRKLFHVHSRSDIAFIEEIPHPQFADFFRLDMKITPEDIEFLFVQGMFRKDKQGLDAIIRARPFIAGPVHDAFIVHFRGNKSSFRPLELVQFGGPGIILIPNVVPAWNSRYDFTESVSNFNVKISKITAVDR